MLLTSPGLLTLLLTLLPANSNHYPASGPLIISYFLNCYCSHMSPGKYVFYFYLNIYFYNIRAIFWGKRRHSWLHNSWQHIETSANVACLKGEGGGFQGTLGPPSSPNVPETSKQNVKSFQPLGNSTALWPILIYERAIVKNLLEKWSYFNKSKWFNR